MSPRLPIDEVLPQLLSALKTQPRAVLSAAPGAGKTTRVPLALMDAPWLAGQKIIMLEPRRLAAMRAAQYMAAQLGEKCGERVGYRVRGDTRVSPRTRIEVVTEGILTRLLQSDPSLDGIGAILFDEFHERSLHADLGLALTLDAQDGLREDLRIVVMSATLDTQAVSALLGDAPVIVSEGRRFPVRTVYLERSSHDAIEAQCARCIVRALEENAEGDLLVFLPGQKEIRRVQEQCQHRLPAHVHVHALFGEAAATQQQAALAPAAAGERKVILSTAIAETSLTIDGVSIVIDAGLSRVSRFDPRRGMSGLQTVNVSQAAAEQRRGRAGRQREGVCYRLWTEHQQAALARESTPEILQADLAPLALELAQWGVREISTLRFLDLPPPALLTSARDLLRMLGALDDGDAITAHGRAMAALPLHPRYAHMLIRAAELGEAALACELAALLEERDLLRGQHDIDGDLHARWRALHDSGERQFVDRGARERARDQARRLRQLLQVPAPAENDQALGLVLALAYPDRIAQRRGERSERYLLASGTGAQLPPGSALSRDACLAIAEIDGIGADARIRLAAPLTLADIETAFSDQIQRRDDAYWDARSESVVARQVAAFGALILSERPRQLAAEKLAQAVLDGVRQIDISALPWPEAAQILRRRSEWLRTNGHVDEQWPDVSDAGLLATLNRWLLPFVSGVTRRTQFERIDWWAALQSCFDYPQLQQLERLAPTHHSVPTGSRIAIDYRGEEPVLAVRLQEMFGEQHTPCIAGGRAPLLIHLLSPRGQPLAVTRDLVSFWQNAYADVRKDMRGQYPKHYWPDDPLQAEPTRRSKAADDRARKARESR